ncbi:MAG: 4'-phosphopantetheinyl transferase superfamily protein [Bacteroides sp.]|nr:4'-phosphopantetheinyl transferase superfamily protein [Bacteroides sp.]
MPIQLLEKEDTSVWGVWKIEESPEELVSLLPDPEKYRRQGSRFRSVNRLNEWLAVRVLLYRLAGVEKEICYHPTGKPYLADGSFHISISHTKGYVSVVIDPVEEVTVDIEYYSDRVKKISSRFIHPSRETLSVYKEDTLCSLLLHWCTKEAMFKYLDEQNVDFQEHLWVHPFTVEEKGTLTAREFCTDKQQLFRIEYFLEPTYILVFCREFKISP